MSRHATQNKQENYN